MKEYVVLKTWDEPIADMALQMLREAGITASKTGEVPRSVLPFTFDGLGEIEIRVPAGEFDRAAEIIAARFGNGISPAELPEDDAPPGPS